MTSRLAQLGAAKFIIFNADSSFLIQNTSFSIQSSSFIIIERITPSARYTVGMVGSASQICKMVDHFSTKIASCFWGNSPSSLRFQQKIPKQVGNYIASTSLWKSQGTTMRILSLVLTPPECTIRCFYQKKRQNSKV